MVVPLDENFVAKLIDVGSSRDVDAGTVIAEGDKPGPLVMVLHGTLLVETHSESYERGAGAVVGYADEPEARVTALTDARVVLISRSDYEAAQTG